MPRIDLDRLVLGPAMRVFGEEGQGYPIAIYTPAGQSSFELREVVFDIASNEIKFDNDGTPLTTVRPTCGVRLALFPGGSTPAQGDQIQLRGKVYDVAEVRPDGHGHARLMLNQARS
jgi:hypothetical protein